MLCSWVVEQEFSFALPVQHPKRTKRKPKQAKRRKNSSSSSMHSNMKYDYYNSSIHNNHDAKVKNTNNQLTAVTSMYICWPSSYITIYGTQINDIFRSFLANLCVHMLESSEGYNMHEIVNHKEKLSCSKIINLVNFMIRQFMILHRASP